MNLIIKKPQIFPLIHYNWGLISVALFVTIGAGMSNFSFIDGVIVIAT